MIVFTTHGIEASTWMIIQTGCGVDVGTSLMMSVSYLRI